MIAATAIVHGVVLVTGNEEHYQRVCDAGCAHPEQLETTTQSP
jgi:predicted nucleic acid-binding protein